MSDSIVTLDVREDIRRGREPFARIMQTLADLKENEKLLLIAPFEPAPLFTVMAQRGFHHTAKPLPGGDWEVLFARNTESAGSKENAEAAASPPPSGRKIMELDARGLEPPQPLVMILEAIETLPEDAELHVRTDRKPMHLYDELVHRGFSGQTEEEEGQGFLTFIRRK